MKRRQGGAVRYRRLVSAIAILIVLIAVAIVGGVVERWAWSLFLKWGGGGG